MYREALKSHPQLEDVVGFYVLQPVCSTNPCGNVSCNRFLISQSIPVRKTIFLVLPESNSITNNESKQLFCLYKPALGRQPNYETKSSLKTRGTRLDSDDPLVRSLWDEHFNLSENTCVHVMLLGKCRKSVRSNGTKCDAGIRKRVYTILSGSVFTVWSYIEKRMPAIQYSKFQIARLKTDDGLKCIGLWFILFRLHSLTDYVHSGPMIPPELVEDVRSCLKNMCASEDKNVVDCKLEQLDSSSLATPATPNVVQ